MMLLEFLIAALAVVGGLVVLAVVAMLIAYLLISWRLAQKLRHTVAELESMLSQSMQASPLTATGSHSPDIPPMRIHLVPASDPPWSTDPLVQRIDQWLLAHSFQRVGDYQVAEIWGEFLHVYLSDDQHLVAATRYQSGTAEPYVEFCVDLGDGLRGGISNPPNSSIGLPADAVGAYFTGLLRSDFELLSQMWLAAKELVDSHDTHTVSPERITEFFEEAHAAEMDNRIACGGVTEAEIRDALQAQGLPVTDADVVHIQQQWQTAIELHLLDYSERGQRQLQRGREVLIVYDGSVGSYLLGRLQERFALMEDCDQEQLRKIVAELTVLLRKFTPREAMARLRPLLPISWRYDLIDQLHQPVAADLYALPQVQ